MGVKEGLLGCKEENVGGKWYRFVQIMQIKVIQFIKNASILYSSIIFGGYEMSCISKKFISYTHILIIRLPVFNGT